MPKIAVAADDEESVEAWACSGAMSLTGPASGPGLGPPGPLVPRLREVASVLRSRSAELGTETTVDPLVLLTERAAITSSTRRGRISCGGATRLLPTAGGWLAVSLARSEDLDLVPAWLGLDAGPDAMWEDIEQEMARRPTAELLERACLLGLPVGALPSSAPPGAGPRPWALPCDAELVVPDGAEPSTALAGVVVADLSSLWAGPLCGSLLAEAGATVLKIESTHRPDGARRGPAPFFDLLNAGKASVALDFTSERGRNALTELVTAADVVIEASRPRALAQLGIDAVETVRRGGPRVWVSITAHGRARGDRVGFGDDAAVSGGLVAWDQGLPHFCADAVADPATGLVAAAAALEALAAGGRWLLDLSLARTASHLAGPTLPVPRGIPSGRPAQRPPRGHARTLGADTERILTGPGSRR